MTGWLKSNAHPARGSASRTARVSSVRGIRRKPQAKRWFDEQKSHMRQPQWIRGQIYSKSGSCTETVEVDVADISVEVTVHYPGRSLAVR